MYEGMSELPRLVKQGVSGRCLCICGVEASQRENPAKSPPSSVLPASEGGFVCDERSKQQTTPVPF